MRSPSPTTRAFCSTSSSAHSSSRSSSENIFVPYSDDSTATTSSVTAAASAATGGLRTALAMSTRRYRRPGARGYSRPVEVRALRPAESAQIAAWRYPGPFSTYDVDDPSTLATDHFAVIEGGELLGYCCFGAPARVDGAAGELSTVDVGYGMAPDHMGAASATASWRPSSTSRSSGTTRRDS